MGIPINVGTMIVGKLRVASDRLVLEATLFVNRLINKYTRIVFLLGTIIGYATNNQRDNEVAYSTSRPPESNKTISIVC